MQTAIAGRDYVATNGTLNFPDDGVLSNSFKVQILRHSSIQPFRFFNVELYSPGGGAGLDTNVPPYYSSNAVVSIVDDNFTYGHLTFNALTFTGWKGSTSSMTVNRTGGGSGTLSVQVVSSNLTGSNGLNYVQLQQHADLGSRRDLAANYRHH